MTLLPHPNDPTEYIRRLADGDERPFIDRFYTDMLAIADEAWDDIFTLLALFFESHTRIRGNPQSKAAAVVAKVAPRLRELATRPFPEEPDALPGYGPFGDTVEWPQQGLLSYMGYRVGARDPGLRARRGILGRVFEGPIPNVDRPEYMVGWGSDGTVQRL